jgi:hypothetical protein
MSREGSASSGRRRGELLVTEYRSRAVNPFGQQTQPNPCEALVPRRLPKTY